MQKKRTNSLWQNRAFIWLWAAEILSNAGSAITRIALPLTAVIALGATPAQMGILGVARSLPNLLFGLFAGVWVDRVRRGPILITADVGRALLLASIPIAALLGRLSFAHLVIVVFGNATLSIFFILASVSVLPSLVEEEQLVEANSKLSVTNSVMGIAGPSVAGGLVQIVTAPIAMIVDAVSYLLSALSLRSVAAQELSTRLETGQNRLIQGNLWREIAEGVRELIRTPILRALTISATFGGLGGAMMNTVTMLFLTHTLGFDPATIGILLAFTGIGSGIGGFLATPISHRISAGPTIILGQLLWAVGALLMPLAGFVEGGALLFVALGQLISGIGMTVYSITQMSLRQQITPTGLFGRATAARRFLIFGAAAVGAALGGVLGTTMGLRPTLLIGPFGFTIGLALIYFSPIRDLRQVEGDGASSA